MFRRDKEREGERREREREREREKFSSYDEQILKIKAKRAAEWERIKREREDTRKEAEGEKGNRA